MAGPQRNVSEDRRATAVSYFWRSREAGGWQAGRQAHEGEGACGSTRRSESKCPPASAQKDSREFSGFARALGAPGGAPDVCVWGGGGLGVRVLSAATVVRVLSWITSLAARLRRSHMRGTWRAAFFESGEMARSAALAQRRKRQRAFPSLWPRWPAVNGDAAAERASEC